MATKQRASHDEILAHLSALLGARALEIVCQSAETIHQGEQEAGVALLTEYDATLGGVGIFMIGKQRPVGLYRAFFYVWLPLHREGPEDDTRRIVYSACIYLEELLKKKVASWPWPKIIAEWLPLGALVRTTQNRLPKKLANELRWLSQGVYNFAKHKFNFEDEAEEPEHYFALDEALAVYLIARKLGLDIESLFGRSPNDLLAEFP